MKIVVVGLGYVGLANAVLLALHNEVIGVDISQERVNALNTRQSPIVDAELSKYLTEKKLNLSATTDLKHSVKDADYIIVSTPTDYDEKTNSFDTSSVEAVIEQVIIYEAKALVDKGTKELLVISQDTSAFGIDFKKSNKTDIVELCKLLGQLDVWVRLHYLYPYPNVTKIIPLMADKKILPYLDIPFQHSHPEVLKLSLIPI